MSSLRRCGSENCSNTFPANGRKQYCSRRCEVTGPGLSAPCVDSNTRRRFAIRCLCCGSDNLTRTTTTANAHRNPATHRAEILVCECGLEMLLSVDLTRIAPTAAARKTR